VEKDKYKAVWLSHSSIADFLNCPRYYFLRNIYKDPLTGHKITRMQPPLALGQAIHEVIEELSNLPVDTRLVIPLTKKFEVAFAKVRGKKGGFKNKAQEDEYFKRGQEMIKKLQKNPGPLTQKAVKINQDLPSYWLSEDDKIILCGKIDWLEYLAETDSVHIVDFKTGRIEENESSLQLPIYHLLVTNTQKRPVAKASYWYLHTDTAPREVKLPDLNQAYSQVYEIGKRIKLARQIEHFKCPKDGCKYCLPLEEIIKGKGELVGESEYRQDIYIL